MGNFFNKNPANPKPPQAVLTMLQRAKDDPRTTRPTCKGFLEGARFIGPECRGLLAFPLKLPSGVLVSSSP